jgi:hypothetical protein
MELAKTGQFTMNNVLAHHLMDGTIFGLNLCLCRDLSGAGDKQYPFLAKENKAMESVAGIIDLGNGIKKWLSLRFTGYYGNPTFDYELSELPEEVDTVHVMD